MIVSLHLPKTGGTSFLALLKDVYGRKLKSDYADLPLNTPLDRRRKEAIAFGRRYPKGLYYLDVLKQVRCIHGHFLPIKYAHLLSKQKTIFITWMRDPIERMISHYDYWHSAYNDDAAPLHKRVVEEKWSLERFCLSDELRNVYDQFLWNFPIENFAFIGVMEHYEEDMETFKSKYLKQKVQRHEHLNKTNERKKSYISDEGLIEDIRKFHSRDYQLYNEALQMRSKRVKEHK